jgi:hypothetical protein
VPLALGLYQSGNVFPLTKLTLFNIYTSVNGGTGMLMLTLDASRFW